MTAFLLLVATLYACMAVQLHNRFMTFGLDLGVFDEWIWKISQGKFPYSGIGCNWMLEDHFQLILYLYAPLYWIWDDARVLLIVQSLVMVLAGLPLYLLAKRVTASLTFSFAVVFSYLFFIGTQFSILNEFHQITVAPLLIALAYLGLEKRDRGLFILCMVGLLITKEDLSLLVAAIGFGLLGRSSYKKIGLLVGLSGIGWFFFLIYGLMPAISYMGVYDHFSHMNFGGGSTLFDLLYRMIVDPAFDVNILTVPFIKVETVIRSLLTYGLLPLLSPFFIAVPLVGDFLTRFIYSGPQITKWGLVNHHAAPSAMLLAIATIYGAQRFRTRYFLFGVVLVCATVVADIVGHGPIHSLLKPGFYSREQWILDTKDVLAHVPPDVSLAAQNSLAPHVGHRDTVYRVPFGLNSEYMVFDLHDGPNKFAPLQYEEMRTFVNDLITSGRYSVVYKKGEAMLLKRNYKTDITKSPYYGDTRFCYYSFEQR